MTEIKNNNNDNSTEKDTNNGKAERKDMESNSKPFTCIHQRPVQLCAWVLLTVVLCIVVITFYVAIQQNFSYNDSNDALNEKTFNNNMISVKNGVNKTFLSGVKQFSFETEESSFQKSGNDVYNTVENRWIVCQEKLCRVVCKNVDNIYKSLHNILKSSPCFSIELLLLERQDFPAGVLKNYWLPSNMSIYEVIIEKSNISKIKTNAFNALIFKNTFALTLAHMNITRMESGALLGLYQLKYLTIKSNIYNFEPVILQPVQTTLMNLKLNANLGINGNENIFGKSNLSNLVYLDLSNNCFNGSLSKQLFKSTPNLKYLIITESQVQYIDEDAFEDMAGKLLFVNLSKNFLTTLGATVFRPILTGKKIAMLNFANNDWLCNCELEELSNLYKKYRAQFIDILYCKAPHHMYGIPLDEVNYQEYDCYALSTVEEKELVSGTEAVEISTGITTSKSYSGRPDIITNNSNFLYSSKNTSTESPPNILKIRCLNENSIDMVSSEQNTESNIALNSLELPAPTYDFTLQLITENNSVIVSVENTSELLVIWFNESPNISYNDASCMSYVRPELMVGPLEENTTYTFCLLAVLNNDISPFNCLPLHVPAKRHENIWISEDNKNFTIGMLCLIFLISTLAGALIAYFSIKTFPDLVVGSKFVMIKRPEQACYVSTISESEYQKQVSMKKEKLKMKDMAFKKCSSNKLPLPNVPSKENTTSSTSISAKDVEKLSSLKSVSTYFEDTFPTHILTNDEYERPNICNKRRTIERPSVENVCGMSPKTPPPLPKRNSNVSNRSTLVINHFSNNFE